MDSSNQNLLLSDLAVSSKQEEYERDSSTVKLLTFNTWGLKAVSKFRNERFNEIINLLAGEPSGSLTHPIRGLSTDSDFDIVALQEIWCENNRNDLRERLMNKYKSRFFSSGVITGPGLGILSKFDITSTWLYRFPVNGVPWAVHRGDFYVGKSVAVTELNVSQRGSSSGALKVTGEYSKMNMNDSKMTGDNPKMNVNDSKLSGNDSNTSGTSKIFENDPKLSVNDSIVVLNSHMHAPYAHSGYNSYLCHRVVQAYDIYKLVTLLQQSGKRIVLVGDLNSKPGSLPHRIMTSLTGLIDSFVSERVFSQDDIASMSCEEQVLLAGTTCDSKLNTWRASREHWEACRLDYALIDPRTLRCVESKVQMTERVPGVGSLSDHFGYSCVLKLEPSDPELIFSVSNDEKSAILREVLTVIDDYMVVNRSQSTWRMLHFLLAVVVVIASMVFITFTANVSGWSSVIVYIGGVVVLGTGLLNGIFGYVFGSSEARALSEVRMEVADELRALV